MSKKMPASRVPPPEDFEEEEEEFEEDEGVEDIPPAEFVKSLEPAQRKRVFALKGLLAEYRAARAQLREKIAALVTEFDAKTAPLADERRKIVAGERDVTAEEAAKGAAATATASKVEEIESDEEDKKKAGRKGVKIVSPADQAAKSAMEAANANPNGGIPSYWLTAMKHHEVVESLITPRDEEALKFLTNVESERLADSGFALKFHFAENPFFSNATLTKKFVMVVDESDDTDDNALDHTEGTEIEWKSVEQNLTIVLKQKKQRHKSGKGVRIVQREEPVPSFFRFFAEEPEEEDEEDEAAEFYDPQLEFEAGVAMHLSVVPRSAHYFSGKSVEEIATSLQMDGAFGFGGEDEEFEEEEEEEEEEVPAPKGKAGPKAGGKAPGAKPGAKPDCKQQ
jgi:nucleosome assembly protein 1-like 1